MMRSLSVLLACAGAIVSCNALVVDPDELSLRPSSGCPSDGCPDGGNGAEGGGDAGDGAAPKYGPDPDAPWPMLGANPAHTSRVDVTGSELKKTNARWSVKTGRLSAGPAVDADGTAYVVTTAGTLAVITLDGKTPWSKGLGGASRCTPALDARGVVYATSTESGLVALTRATGEKLWSVPVGGSSHPVIGPDGVIYVIDAAGVQAVSPEGKVAWTYPLGPPGGARDEAVAVGDDGILYAVRDGLHAIQPNGQRLWHSDDGDALSPPPVVALGGVFVGSGTAMAAVDLSGKRKWTSPVRPRLRASPAVAKSGLLYFFDDDQLGTISANDGLNNVPTGSLGIKRPFTPMIDRVDVAYAANSAGLEFPEAARFRLDARSQGSWSLESEPVGFAVAKDGTVFIATSPTDATPGGELVALPP